VTTGVDIGAKLWLKSAAAALALMSVAAVSAASPPDPVLPAKPVAAKPIPAPGNPFNEAAPPLPITGALPNLAQLDFMQMSQLLYAHLLADSDPARSGLIIEAVLARATRDCRQVSAFQIYRYRTGSRTLKVKCPGKPLYVMTVGNSGGVQISGGDGTIPELQTTDGRIYSLFGREIQVPKPYAAPLAPSPGIGTTAVSSPGLSAPAQSPEPVAPPKAAPATAGIPVVVPAQQQPQGTYIRPEAVSAPIPAGAEPPAAEQQRFRSWLLVINGIAVGLLTLGIWGYLRSRRRSQGVRDYGLSSDDKDLLLDESREIYPGIFQHPQGFFLARGRRGKRRLFRTALFAILYRDFSIKFGEIQI
jgi:hypothetical protein